jgi:DNA primase
VDNRHLAVVSGHTLASVAGRISEADKERVRDANRIEQVVGEYVALRNAGGGNLKGLCPFHDEKTPSFQVSPARGYYHCFGCDKGGDVFAFLQELEHLTFMETVQRLAERANITLTVMEGGSSTRSERGTRPRLLAANKAAAEFYAAQLLTEEAGTAQTFLADRGFDLAAAAHFGCGYAPDGWDKLVKALTAQGFSLDELYRAGLARQGQRGPIDQFHRRLLWSLRDAAGDVVGFGARRLFDDDRLEAKYVNTSETPLYKKSQVLFGLDLAKRDISRQRRAVVVEGYTDVMAMHLAGVTTAVASCGTAFGDDHISVLRRYLLDSEVIRGEVVYTFDGDSAGQKAAIKAFDSDQKFAANTYVAVAPAGMDPCELRQAKGDEAVKALVENRTPLFAFAIKTTLKDYNLETAEGRVAATTATIPLVARIKEPTLRDEYIRQLAGWLGSELAPIRQRVRDFDAAEAREAKRAAARQASQNGAPQVAGSPGAGQRPPGRPGQDQARPGTVGPGKSDRHDPRDLHEPPPEPPDHDDEPPEESDHAVAPGSPAVDMRRPNPTDRSTFVERETLKLVLQQPDLVVAGYEQVSAEAFTNPAYAAVHAAVEAAGGPPADGSKILWVDTVAEHVPAGPWRSLVSELAVEPLRNKLTADSAEYAGSILAGMALRIALADESRLKSAMQRAEAAGDRDRRLTLQADLAAVTNYRRALADMARGQSV